MIIASALLALSSAASDLQLTWHHGVLGSVLELEVSGGAPGASFAVLPSQEPGPTPLPGGTVLQVGLDRLGLLRIGQLDGAGEGSVTFGLDPGLSLAGMAVRAQAIELSGAPFGPVSNPIECIIGTVGDASVLEQGPAVQGRRAECVDLGGGRTLVVGGLAEPGSTAPLALRTFDLQRNAWRTSDASLGAARFEHTVSALDDGRVLIAGGFGAGGIAFSNAFVYDPVADSLSAPLSIGSARGAHTATKLDDGRVALIGGAVSWSMNHPIGHPASTLGPQLVSIAIFDPATDSFSVTTGATVGPLVFHTATALPDGDVWIAGGLRRSGGSASSLDGTWLWDPAADSFTPGPSLGQKLALHGAVGTADGRVLISGGATIQIANASSATTTGSLASSVFDPASNALVAGPTATGILVDGRRICIEGEEFPSPFPSAGVFIGREIYYFAAGGFSDLDVQAGTATWNTAVQRTTPALTTWESGGDFGVVRRGPCFAVDGPRLRVTAIGPRQGAPDPGCEQLVLDVPTTP